MKNKGFSLVELIVVIAIMAILVGVAVPVYSSYVEKANAAKDEQLLGEINSAFAVVCAGNAIDINTVIDATIDIENGAVKLSTMVVKVGSTEIAGFAEAMVGILGNDLEFAVIEEIFYNPDTHKFEENADVEVVYGGTTFILSAKDIAALKNSTFGEKVGIEALLEKVGNVTGFAANVDSAAFEKVLGSLGFRNSAAIALGLDPDDEELGSKLNAKLKALAAELMAKDPTLTEEQAIAQVQANAAVLYAAQNTTKMTTDEITNWLCTDGAKGQITSNLNGDTGLALSQAALAYGMYTSYANYVGDPDLIASTDNPLDILNGLNDDDFQKYVASEQGQKDLEGYLSAMNMINGSTTDPDAVGKLMVNGYTDTEFKDALAGAFGN